MAQSPAGDRRPTRNERYVEVDAIRVADGPDTSITAFITQRVDDESFSFALVKEYRSRDGEDRRTAFFSRRQVASLREVLDRLDERLASEEARVAEARVGRVRGGA